MTVALIYAKGGGWDTSRKGTRRDRGLPVSSRAKLPTRMFYANGGKAPAGYVAQRRLDKKGKLYFTGAIERAR